MIANCPWLRLNLVNNLHALGCLSGVHRLVLLIVKNSVLAFACNTSRLPAAFPLHAFLRKTVAFTGYGGQARGFVRATIAALRKEHGLFSKEKVSISHLTHTQVTRRWPLPGPQSCVRWYA